MTDKTIQNRWQPPAGTTIPDFILAGAMKCGTSTLHSMLAAHPDVFIPDEEIHFFDRDDMLLHPDFQAFDGQHWQGPILDERSSAWWQWYSDQFAGASPGQKLGEDSTIYLASEQAAQRISSLDKDIKVVVSLRNPTARVYSQYWHMLRTGRATYSFENTLRFAPHSIVHNSLYLEQLQRMFQHIDRDRVLVVLFEDLIQDPKQVLTRVCKHINVDPGTIPDTAFQTHSNPARLPKYPGLQVWKNRLLREHGNQYYRGHGPQAGQYSMPGPGLLSRVLNKVHALVNPLVVRKPPPMLPASKAYLDTFFHQRLQGLDELLGQEVLRRWFND